MADVFEEMMKEAEEAGFNEEISREMDDIKLDVSLKDFGEAMHKGMITAFGLPFFLENENQIALACAIAIQSLNSKYGFFDKSEILDKLGIGGDTDEPERDETV